MKNNRKLQLLIAGVLVLSPLSAFATGGDTTFNDVIKQIKDLTGGSLGLLFCLLSFLWLLGSLAGGGGFKAAGTVFGVCIAGRYGPAIIEKIFGAGATGSLSTHTILTAIDIVFLIAIPAAIGLTYSYRKAKLQSNPSLNNLASDLA